MWYVIDRRMKELGITAYEVAKRAGLTRQAIYAIRDGRKKDITLTTAFKLADALGIDVNEFRKEV